jgi:GTP pyrophosphokinase
VAQVLTISQLNRIGERLRRNQENDADLRALDDFRVSFEPAYQRVFDLLTQLGLKPGGRAGKTTLSIKAKLIRERTRLSRMQDIAGCRVVVDTVADQDRTAQELKVAFPKNEVFDRREKPSHGYRALHIVAYIPDVPVEVQIRTTLQHAWAEVSEKLSDFDQTIKYGGGPPMIRNTLDDISAVIRTEEEIEGKLRALRARDTDGSLQEQLEKHEETIRDRKLNLHTMCRELIITLESIAKKS